MPGGLQPCHALQGEIDYSSAAELRSAISAAVAHDPRPALIVVDLGRVELVDHPGVGTLVVAHRICRDVGIELAVRSPSRLIRHLLGMPGHQPKSGADSPVPRTTRQPRAPAGNARR